MQALGDQLFSGTVRSGDQDPRIGGGNLLDDFPHVLDGLGFTDHLFAVDLLLEDLDVILEIGLVRCVLDGYENAYFFNPGCFLLMFFKIHWNLIRNSTNIPLVAGL